MDKIKAEKKITDPISDEEWELVKKDSLKEMDEAFKKIFYNNKYDHRFAPEPLDNKILFR